MAEDIIKPNGPTNRSKPGGMDANPQMVPLLGVVKDNIDPTRAGRIFVYLANNSGLDPDNRENWRPVKMLTPFFGSTRGDGAKDNYGNFKNNPSSYGMWMAPPDIGTTVLCLFVNGDLNYGFYIGCVPDPDALQMVPAIGATDNVVPNKGEAQSYGGSIRLPVTNINKNNKAIVDTPDYLTAAKPVHSYTSAVMFQQGILRDPIRGPISTSSQRETPSRVGWGVSTPGRPIYEGGYDDKSIVNNLSSEKNNQLRVVSRRGGHTIIMDDGDIIGRDNLVRIRTSLGHQILMSDDGQTLMILHSNGQSYIELGKEGTVDIYSTNSVNIRTQGDLNLHADNNVNIHAAKNFNLQAENIQINTEKEFKQRVGTNYTNFTLGKHTTKVTGAMSMESKGDISMASSSLAYVNGSKIYLNTGQTSTKPAEVPAIEKVLHTDTLFDAQKGYLAAPAKLVSITSRAPAHAPWSNAGQGVDIKTDLNSSSQLPSSPNTSVSTTNDVAASAGVRNPVNVATTATAPTVSAVSQAIDVNATKAITGQIAADAANGPLAEATTKGVAIAQTEQGTTVGVGQYAQTPEQLEKSGVLKPGAAALVTTLAAATGNAISAFTNNLFTGKSGAENLPTFLSNKQAQNESIVQNLQQAQVQLQNSAVVTGKEIAGQLGGLILSTAKNGLLNTLDAVKNSAQLSVQSELANFQFGLGSATSQAFQGQINGLSGSIDGVMKDIAAGNFAGSLGELGQGALNGLESSVKNLLQSPSLEDAINQASGIASKAFSAIASSMKPLKAGVPQNLSTIAKQNIESNEVAANSGKNISDKIKNAANKLANIAVESAVNNTVSGLNSSLYKLNNTAQTTVAESLLQIANVPQTNNRGSSAIASSFNNASNLLNNGNDALTSLSNIARSVGTSAAMSAVSSLASGLSNLPGGQNAVSSVTNLSIGNMPNLPGINDLSNIIQNTATNALNNVTNNLQVGVNQLLTNTVSDLTNNLSSLIPKNLPAGLSSQLQNAIGSIAAAGSGIKIPSIGLNTNDRSSINIAVINQLDDPGIPPPTFGNESIVEEIFENLNRSIEEEETTRRSELAAQVEKARKEYDAQNQVVENFAKQLATILESNKKSGIPYTSLPAALRADQRNFMMQYNKEKIKLERLDATYRELLRKL